MRDKVQLGRIYADRVTFRQTLDRITELVRRGQGGYVVTPNVDHVVLSEKNDELRCAYEHAALSVVDGMPLVWLSKLLRQPLPEKISGSDLARPLLERAANEQWRIVFLGAAPGVGDQAADNLRREMHGINIVDCISPDLGFEKDAQANAAAIDRISAAEPHLILVALGCPKQELWMAQHATKLAPAVLLGIGATLDFIAGNVRRAPRWMSRTGLEWVYRILQEPRRMAHRYLIRDAAFAPIALRMLAASLRKS